MTFTFEHFMISIFILIAIGISLVILYFLGFLIFRSYCSLDDTVDMFTVEKLIDMRISSEMSKYNSNSLNSLKSENKLKSTKCGRK